MKVSWRVHRMAYKKVGRRVDLKDVTALLMAETMECAKGRLLAARLDRKWDLTAVLMVGMLVVSKA